MHGVFTTCKDFANNCEGPPRGIRTQEIEQLERGLGSIDVRSSNRNLVAMSQRSYFTVATNTRDAEDLRRQASRLQATAAALTARATKIDNGDDDLSDWSHDQ